MIVRLRLCLVAFAFTQVACGGGEGAYSSDVPSSAMTAAVMVHDATQTRSPAANAVDCQWAQEEAQPAETFSGCQTLAMDMPTDRRGLTEGFIPQDEAHAVDPQVSLSQASNLAFNRAAPQQKGLSLVEATAPSESDKAVRQAEVAVVAGIDASKRAGKPLISLKDL